MHFNKKINRFEICALDNQMKGPISNSQFLWRGAVSK